MQSTSASTTRLRCDPTDYAKKQQLAKDRAKELKDQRQKGFVSNEHTFAPKVNPRARTGISSREEPDRTMQAPPSNSYDDIPIRPAKSSVAPMRSNPEEAPLRPARQQRGNNNHDDNNSPQDADALDNLSRRYPKKPVRNDAADNHYSATPLDPEHDTLFREVKKATGRELSDSAIKKPAPVPRQAGGVCQRNSSCTCPKCAGIMGGTASGFQDDIAPIRRRESRPAQINYDQDIRQSATGRQLPPQSEIESSLSLLKSKMSRRKARSAPTNQASLFIEKQTPREVAQSARDRTSSSNAPPVAARKHPPSQPPPQQSNSTKRAPPRQVESQDNAEDDAIHYPGPITKNTTINEEDEYGEVEDVEECPNCQRKFNIVSFEKHQKVCSKVFSATRKVFNMKAKRLQGMEVEKVAKKSSSGGGGGVRGGGVENQPIKAKTADWKQQSNAFREAMKASRSVTQALKEGRELPPMKPSAPDPSLIQCEHCSRRFNEKAAERHIAFCKEKSQRDNISRGPGPKKAGGGAVPPPKPSRAAAPPPRKK